MCYYLRFVKVITNAQAAAGEGVLGQPTGQKLTQATGSKAEGYLLIIRVPLPRLDNHKNDTISFALRFECLCQCI